MSAFWDSLERSARPDQKFEVQRQTALREAEAGAIALFEIVTQDKPRLANIGVTASVDERTVSFKKGGLEVLVVTFGIDDTGRIRIHSPIFQFLKLSPAYVDVHDRERTVDLAGEWLGKSIEQVRANEPKFKALGLI